jgi:hypothetical protein
MSFETTPIPLSHAGAARPLLTSLTALVAIGMVLAPALGFVLLLID